jgi:DNA repair and recombination protein RAD52
VSHDTDSDPDGVVLPSNVPSRHVSGGRPVTNTTAPVVGATLSDQKREPPPQANQMQARAAPTRQPNVIQMTEATNGRNLQQPPQAIKAEQPNTNGGNGFVRLASGASTGGPMRAPADGGAAARPPQAIPPGPGRVLNQPSRNGPASAPHSPAQAKRPFPGSLEETPENRDGQPVVESGFFSARAVAMVPEVSNGDGPPTVPLANLPTFNPHAESPSIRRTPGIDHTSTKPLSKELKHVPSSTQAGAATSPAPNRTNIVNPQLDAARRIGAPGSPSPMANRSSYRPPTMKRPHQAPNLARPPLGDIPANGTVPGPDGGGDMKRPRLSG